MKKVLFALAVMACTYTASSQNDQAGPYSQKIYFSPSEGLQGSITIHYGYKVCFDEILMTLGWSNLQINSYRRNGKKYFAADLGLSNFQEEVIGLSSIKVSSYNSRTGGSYGSSRGINVQRDFTLGCYGETIYIISKTSFKDNLSEIASEFSNVNISYSGSLSFKADNYEKKIKNKQLYEKAMVVIDNESSIERKLELINSAYQYAEDRSELDELRDSIRQEIALEEERIREEERMREEEEAKIKEEEKRRQEEEGKEKNASALTNGSSALDEEGGDDSTKKEDYEDDEDEEEEESDDDGEHRSSTSSYNAGMDSDRPEDSAKYQMFQQRMAAANEMNADMAATASATTVGLIFLLGGGIYHNYGWAEPDGIRKPDQLNGFVNLEAGFSGTTAPLAFASSYRQFDFNTDEEFVEDLTKPAQQVTLNLEVKVRLGIENNNYNAHLYGGLRGGVNPLLGGSLLGTFYGAKAAVGVKNAKLLAGFEAGGRGFTISDFIIEQEEGKGESKLNYYNLRGGLEFSWYGNPKAYARNHLSFGLIRERITKLKGGTNLELLPIEPFEYDGVTYEYNREDGIFFDSLDIINNSKDYAFFGGFLEWRHDHHGTLSIEYFPQYPHAGTINPLINPDDWNGREGNIMLNISFKRNLDAFF